MKYNWFYILAFFIFTQCGSSQEEKDSLSSDRCNCPLEQNKDGDVSSTITDNSDTMHDWMIGGKLSPKEFIKKAIDAEVELYYKGKNTNDHTKTVVKEFKEMFPEIQNYANFRKEFYCAFIKIICLDTTRNIKELEQMKLEKLEIIQAAIDAKYSVTSTTEEKIEVTRKPKNITSHKEKEIKICEINGKVVDKSNNPIVDAVVELSSLNLESQKTNSLGIYKFSIKTKYSPNKRIIVSAAKDSLQGSILGLCNSTQTITIE